MGDDRPERAKELFARIDQMEENLSNRIDRGFRKTHDLLGQIGEVLLVMSGQMDRLLDLTRQNQAVLIEIRDLMRLGMNGRGATGSN